MDNSTFKMLAKMQGQNKSQSIDPVDVEQSEVFNNPQLRPVSEMEQVLSNILGKTSTKDHSPMD